MATVSGTYRLLGEGLVHALSFGKKVRQNLPPVVFAIGLTGCTTNQYATSNQDWKARLEERHRTPQIIVQLCTPVATPGFGVGMIRRWSIGGGTEKKTGVTTNDQAIYETYADFPEETVAITTKPSRTSALSQVFFPPKNIVTSNWSDWFPPAFESDDPYMELKLFHGKPFNKLPLSKDSPKIRYILMSFNDYLERVKQRRLGQFSETAPPC